MRKSVSESGSKNYSSSPPTTTCDTKIEPIDGSMIPISPREYISIPANSFSDVPPGFIFSNQVILANHFTRNESKGHHSTTITAPQIKDESNHESIFHWMLKRRYGKKEDSVKSNPCAKIDAEYSDEEKNGPIFRKCKQ